MKQKYFNTEEEWHEWRQTGIGSSDAPIIMLESPWATPYELWRQKLGYEKKEVSQFATEKGHRLEPQARAEYELNYGYEIPPANFEHEDLSFMHASLDGWNADKKTIVEIKYSGKEDFELARQGKVPEKYKWQLQHQLFVCSEAQRVHYVAFNEKRLHVVEVKREPVMQTQLIEACYKFWNCVREIRAPDLCDRDVREIKDEKLEDIVYLYNQTNVNMKSMKEQMESYKKILVNSLQDLPGKKFKISNFVVQKTFRKGNVDYAKIPLLKDIDLNEYRKKGSEVWTIKSQEEG